VNKSAELMQAWKSKRPSQQTHREALKLIGVQQIGDCLSLIEKIKGERLFTVTPMHLVAIACLKYDEKCHSPGIIKYNLKNFNKQAFIDAHATYFGGTKTVQQSESESMLLDFRDAENDRLKKIIAALQQENTRLVVENHTLRGNQ
jgi:hypothetical protein